MIRSNNNNRVQGSGRRSVRLAEPLLRHLNGYRLAAGAAGVAMLGYAARPAEAAPICGTLSVTFTYTETYAFNPAHQKIAPFNVAQTFNEISSHTQSLRVRGFFTPNTPDAKELLSANGLPADVASGASIGPGGHFGKGRSYGRLFGYYYFNKVTGNFKPGQVGYVGFQFSEQGQTHYGWVRVQVTKRGRNLPFLVLSEFGYESTPNTAILAGSCTASAAGAAPTPSEASAPASLGLLALGSEAIAFWRRAKLP